METREERMEKMENQRACIVSEVNPSEPLLEKERDASIILGKNPELLTPGACLRCRSMPRRRIQGTDESIGIAWTLCQPNYFWKLHRRN